MEAEAQNPWLKRPRPLLPTSSFGAILHLFHPSIFDRGLTPFLEKATIATGSGVGIETAEVLGFLR